mmetsp:Transcript_34545/g.86783  ORF Transcript_34545/g.86783 Transcript_34545/m.86783 type:complete len:230 (+) Transcript_34545:175-864(+)
MRKLGITPTRSSVFGCLQSGSHQLRVHRRGETHTQTGLSSHCFADRAVSMRVARPGTTAHAVVHIPVKHETSATCCSLTAIHHEPEPAIHRLTPASSTSVVETDPGCTAETVSHKVLDRHVRCVLGSVTDVGGLTEGAVGSTHIMVIPTQNNWCLKFTTGYGFVEGERNFNTALSIGVENASLRTDHKTIFVSFADPEGIVLILHAVCCGSCLFAQSIDHFTGQPVGDQ